MSVNLQKGQKVDLTKGNAGLKRIMVGLGWDEAPKGGGGKGLFGSLFGGGNKAQDIDCDASCLLLTEGGKLRTNEDVVYYGNLTHKSGAIKHMGDNLTGAGDGDDEQILVDLSGIPQNVEKLVFAVTIYQAVQRNQHFGMIQNAFIRIVDNDTNQELCRYNLSENYDHMTSMIFGEVYRYNNEWKFTAIGAATTDNGLGEVVRRYQ